MVKKNENIKVIFFDIGGVLLHIHHDKMINHISDITGLSYEKVRLSFPEKGHDIYEKGQMTNQEWFHTFKSALPGNADLKENEFWDAWEMILGEESKVIDILLELKNHYKVWLLSNTNPKHIQDELENKYIFPQLVDGAIYSYDVGLRKPHESIYIKACELAKVNPVESVFIDDLIENIQAAKDLGINAIHFESIEKLKIEMNDIGINI